MRRMTSYAMWIQKQIIAPHVQADNLPFSQFFFGTPNISADDSIFKNKVILNYMWLMPLFTKHWTLGITCDFCNQFDGCLESTSSINDLVDYIICGLVNLVVKTFVSKGHRDLCFRCLPCNLTNVLKEWVAKVWQLY